MRPGWFTERLAAQGFGDVVGIDVSPAMIEFARDTHRLARFELGSVTQLPFPDGAFDGVFCWYVLHHVPESDFDSVVDELARMVAPGGWLLIGGHAGTSSYVKTDGYGGHPMNVAIVKREAEAIAHAVRARGMSIVMVTTVDPDSERRSGLVLATRPDQPNHHHER